MKKPTIKEADFNDLRNWAIVNFLVGTGCRASTLCAVKISDIDFDGGLIYFSKNKNKRSASVPLSQELSKVLNFYLQYFEWEEGDPLFPSSNGRHLTVDGLTSAIKRYNINRGVTMTSLHAFRHTFAKNWIMNGGDIFRLQKILGHKTLEMVRNYVNLYGQDLQKDYDKYNPLSKFSETKVKIKLRRK